MVADLDIARRQTMYLLFPPPPRQSRELTRRKQSGRERRHPVHVVCRSTRAGLSRQERRTGHLPSAVVVPRLMALTANWELCFPGADGKRRPAKISSRAIDVRPRQAETFAEVIPLCDRFPRRLTRSEMTSSIRIIPAKRSKALPTSHYGRAIYRLHRRKRRSDSSQASREKDVLIRTSVPRRFLPPPPSRLEISTY